MGSSTPVPGAFDDLRSHLTHRAFLYDSPDDFLAGVDAALAAMSSAGGPVKVEEDPERQGWPKAQRLAP